MAVVEMYVDALRPNQRWPDFCLKLPFAKKTAKTSTSDQHLSDALQNARDYMDQTKDFDDYRTRYVRFIIQTLYDEIESRKPPQCRKDRKNHIQVFYCSYMLEIVIKRRTLGTISEKVLIDRCLRDEPHFESMISTDFVSRLNVKQSSEDGGDEEEDEEIDIRNIYKGLDPVVKCSMMFNYSKDLSGTSALSHTFR